MEEPNEEPRLTAAEGVILERRRQKLRKIWRGMLDRCYDKKNKYYGGKGISVCFEWHAFEEFEKDMGPSYAPGLTIDRKDSAGDYTKENCWWLTRSEHSRKTQLENPHVGRGFWAIHRWKKRSVDTDKLFAELDKAIL
jgi:hypothetical protein